MPGSQIRYVDFYDYLPNPDNLDEADSDLMLQLPCSDYFSISDINESVNNNFNHSCMLFHCNIVSLSKNLNRLENLMITLDKPPEILAITETRLSSKLITNVNIENYSYHNDSPTMAGGTAIYVKESLTVINRPDITINMAGVESTWIEIDNHESKPNVIIGCVYRHPNGNLNEFISLITSILKSLANPVI